MRLSPAGSESGALHLPWTTVGLASGPAPIRYWTSGVAYGAPFPSEMEPLSVVTYGAFVTVTADGNGSTVRTGTTFSSTTSTTPCPLSGACVGGVVTPEAMAMI